MSETSAPAATETGTSTWSYCSCAKQDTAQLLLLDGASYSCSCIECPYCDQRINGSMEKHIADAHQPQDTNGPPCLWNNGD